KVVGAHDRGLVEQLPVLEDLPAFLERALIRELAIVRGPFGFERAVARAVGEGVFAAGPVADEEVVAVELGVGTLGARVLGEGRRRDCAQYERDRECDAIHGPESRARVESMRVSVAQRSDLGVERTGVVGYESSSRCVVWPPNASRLCCRYPIIEST